MKNMYNTSIPAHVVIKFNGEVKKIRASRRGKEMIPTVSFFLVM